MASDEIGGLADSGMLDLFRMEAEAHSVVLEKGLIELESAPGAAGRLEELMRAAHSIKGAARIVGLDALVGLAHNIEDLLSAAQKGAVAIDPHAVDILLQGTDVFKRVSGVAADGLASWLREEQPGIGGLEKALSAILAGEAGHVEAAQGAEGPGPASEQAQAPSLPEIQAAPGEAAPGLELIDLSMFDLFTMEAASHAASLESGLMELESEPASAGKIEPLMRAAHSIKGAARIVGLDALVGLAHNMEDLLSAAQKGAVVIDPHAVDILLQGTDVFKRVSGVAADGLASWLREEQPGIGGLEKALSAILAGEAGHVEAAQGAEGPGPESVKAQAPTGPEIQAAPGEAASGLELIDLSMFDLFTMEAASHAASLESGLMELESEPASAGKIEPLMRAAHSIKGAARIVGLDALVGLAHNMEDLLSAAQKGAVVIDPHAVDILLQGTDVFKRVSGVAADGLASWLREEQPGIGGLEKALSAILAGEAGHVEAAQGAEGPGPESVRAQAPTGPEIQAAPGEAASGLELIDLSMFDLFTMEAASHAASLESGLMELESEPASAGKIEPLMRAAHSIKGAARIVGLDSVVQLAHVMEDLLTDAQKGKVKIEPKVIDLLLRGVDSFKRLSTVGVEGLESWLRGPAAEVSGIRDALVRAMEVPLEAAPSPERPVAKGPGPESAPQARTVPPPTEPAPGGKPAARLEQQQPERQSSRSESDNAVLVTAENISRLMGLAGECLVQSRSLQSHAQGLYQLKSLLGDVSKTIEDLREAQLHVEPNPTAEGLLAQSLAQSGRCRESLVRQIESFEMYMLRWENLASVLYNEAVATRMRPFNDGAHGFPRMVRDIARKLGKKIKLTITGGSTKVDRDILARMEAPLTHILRNACDHGIEMPEERLASGKPEEGVIRMEAGHRAGMLSILIGDDGRGIDPEGIRRKVVERGNLSPEMAQSLGESELMEFLFLSGFSTARVVTETSGRGVGLDVVKSMVQEVRGTVSVTSRPGEGTTFHMQLPLTLSVLRTLVVEIAGEPYAFPLVRVDRVIMVAHGEIEVIEDRQYFPLEGQNIGLVPAYQPLDLGSGGISADRYPVVVISDRLNQYGVVVDKLVGEHELVVRPLDSRLGKVPNISAAAVKEDGSPILVFDVDDLVRSIDKMLRGGTVARLDRVRKEREGAAIKRVLVVDDSITVREVERRLLDHRGYEVDVAVDGMDGWNAVRAGNYDLVISDVDMPRMNGIELVKNIKSDPGLKHLPIIIVSYKDREEDRITGLDAGANYYLTKSSFYDESFLKAVQDLIGEP